MPPDTMPPPTPDPSDLSSEAPTDPQGRKKVDVIEMLRNAHGEAHATQNAIDALKRVNEATPLESKFLRQLRAAFDIFHEIRNMADNLRPAVAAASLMDKEEKHSEALSVLQGLLVGIDTADDAIRKYAPQAPKP